MKKYSVILVCTEGLSTFTLLNQLKEYAAANDVDLQIDACGALAVEEKSKGAELILLGPQAAYQCESISKRTGVPTVAIPLEDYTTCNCEDIVQLIQNALD